MTILVDTREQAPYDFPGQDVETAALAAGDYSLAGLQDHIAVERKELADLIGCVTHDRDRFKRELQRLRAYRFSAVVIEAGLPDILAHKYRSETAPAAVLGSLTKWMARYQVPFVFAGDRTSAEAFTAAYLRNAAAHVEDVLRAVIPQDRPAPSENTPTHRRAADATATP